MKLHILEDLSFGERIAEEEIASLAKYFVETREWKRLYKGEKDIVYGAKGSGKSALYHLLWSKRAELLDERKIILLTAEKPDGMPIFRSLADKPPITEREFAYLWKLYFLSLVGGILKELQPSGDYSKKIINTLEESGLLVPDRNIRTVLRTVLNYLDIWSRIGAIETEVKSDPTTGIVGIGGKITLKEPSYSEQKQGYISVHELFEMLDAALAEVDHQVWILLDRLDVAFTDTPEIEVNALHGLFNVYLDLRGLNNLKLKIFLRSDIWQRITRAGFPEASHFTRTMTISWDKDSLRNLIIKRMLQNESLVNHYVIDREATLKSIHQQEEMLARVFPPEIFETSYTFRTTDIESVVGTPILDWILRQTRDGTGNSAPREVIHLLNTALQVQIQRIDIGHSEPEGSQLFDQASFEGAMPEVSKIRLEMTLFAEYPDMIKYMEAFTSKKSVINNLGQFAEIWQVQSEDVRPIVDKLVAIGFLKPQEKSNSHSWFIPEIYQHRLRITRIQVFSRRQ